jgi:molybdate transport system substrate-binding protein
MITLFADMRRLVLGLLLIFLSAGTAWAGAPLVAAAADLKFALEEVSASFIRDTQLEVNLVFGSSGNFYRQIEQGALFQLFLSADEDFIFKLAATGKTLDHGTLYAVGRIGIVVPNGSPVVADGELTDLAAAIVDGRLRRFAIANPEHAPYGKRAVEALKHAGLWEKIQDKLVLGENVTQTAQFALSGSTQGGIIAYSLVLSPTLAAGSHFALIPAPWHKPLRQRMVLMKNAGQTAQLFYRYLQQPAARAIMKKYGFMLPDET